MATTKTGRPLKKNLKTCPDCNAKPMSPEMYKEHRQKHLGGKRTGDNSYSRVVGVKVGNKTKKLK